MIVEEIVRLSMPVYACAATNPAAVIAQRALEMRSPFVGFHGS
jgi:hypothetical protein